MLSRVLETEVMDTTAEAIDYDAMDHSEVNRVFVADLLGRSPDLARVLDIGTGTALIPIELCRQAAPAQVVAVDAAAEMLKLAGVNVRSAGFDGRITLEQVDAKRLPFADRSFSAVVSNSIVHHIPYPLAVLAEAVRVCDAGGTLFFRDLLRPDDLQTLERLVQTYAAGASVHARQMFTDSLHAALSLAEIRELISSLGFPAEDVQQTSDRHWTWCSRKT